MLNHVQGQVWKRVWIFEARSENGCGKWHFWSEIGSGFGDAGGTPPPKIPRSTPPDYKYSFELFRPSSSTKKSTENYLFTIMQVTTPSKTEVLWFRDERMFFKPMQLRNVSQHGFKSERLLKTHLLQISCTCYVISPGQLDDFHSKHHNKSHLPQVSNSLQPG